jgi:ribosomal protein S11
MSLHGQAQERLVSRVQVSQLLLPLALLLNMLRKKQWNTVLKKLTFSLRAQALDVKLQSVHLQTLGIEVVGIKDVTPLPHNGCRLPKRRRV